jgi:Amt family ammonium transporter
VICFFASTSLKNALGYDDSLDAFGVHAIGGIIGAMLTGVFATKAVTGAATAVGWIDGNPGQVLTQFYGVAVTIVYDAVVSFILLKLIDVTIGLRVTEDEEREGLDITQHGESVA